MMILVITAKIMKVTMVEIQVVFKTNVVNFITYQE